jgi:hypothetical protein
VTPAARRAAAERQRRCRLRRRNGQGVYAGVTADSDVLDMLVALGWLRDADAVDPQAVAAAISAMLKASSSRRDMWLR